VLASCVVARGRSLGTPFYCDFAKVVRFERVGEAEEDGRADVSPALHLADTDAAHAQCVC